MAGSVLASSSLFLQGCYEALPVRSGAPPAVLTVQLVLNDRGRLAVDKTFGGAIDRIEGVVTSQSADSCTIAVGRAIQLAGGTSIWNGLPVTIAKDGFEGYRIYQFSALKTAVLFGGIALGIIGVVTLVKNQGSTPPPDGTVLTPPTPTSALRAP